MAVSGSGSGWRNGPTGAADAHRGCLVALVARHLRLEVELGEVVTSLSDAGVQGAVLKGVPLARRLYGDLAHRGAIVDNDILVRRADAASAVGVLHALGYRAEPGRTLAAHLRTDFQIALGRQLPDGTPLVVDLHWAPFAPQLYRLDEATLWAHVEPFPLGATSVLVPDEALTLVHLASHYAQHLFAVDRPLVDFAQGWNAWGGHIDVDGMLDLARLAGLLAALDFAFTVAGRRGLLTCPAPEIRSRRAARLCRRLPAGRSPTPPPDYRGRLLALRLADPRRAAHWAWDMAFPPPATQAAITGRAPGPAVWPSYLTRLVRVPWRAWASRRPT